MILNFSDTLIRQLSKTLEEAATQRELTALLIECKIAEQGGTPKWERITLALIFKQNEDGCGNSVIQFIQAVMNPVRFVGKTRNFEDFRNRLNETILFAGFQLSNDGKISEVTAARTLSEAAQRAGRLRNLLQQRLVHVDVLVFCQEELLTENYFHAVFEATKSVAEKIRTKSGLLLDGTELVDQVFALKNPILAINPLRTETDQSEHKGFANLLRGVFGTFRNVTAHTPKIHWTIEELDALDLLTMVSYLHRKLDKTVKVLQSKRDPS
jgi:uncharacterized protein (TIGR02391 family)